MKEGNTMSHKHAVRNIIFVAVITFAFVFSPLLTPVYAAEVKKELVILDSDMVEMYDDGLAMLMLAFAPNVKLLGITTVSGNTWMEQGTSFTMSQLEAVGKANSVPVAMGFNFPQRKGRVENIKKEREQFGSGHDNWQGAASSKRPTSWRELYRAYNKKEPVHSPIKEHAVDFIIKQVKKYPGKVTIAAIGPCTNIAEAIRKAPEIVPLVKRIVYMGGSFFIEGNVTPTAEFNIWFDPEAAKYVMRSPFKEQIVVPLDVCEKVHLTAARYAETEAHLKNKTLIRMLHSNYFYGMFQKNPKFSTFVWDTIVAALIMDPSIIKEEISLPIDVNDVYSLSYGETLAFRGVAPKGAQTARIVLTIDESKLWRMIFDSCDKM